MDSDLKPGQSQTSMEDAEKNMAMGILAYILFFVPLLAARDSQFAMYHANQGLVLFLTALAVNIIGGLIPVVGWFFLIPLLNLAILIFAVIGIINAAQKKTAALPLIGKIQLIK